MQKVLALLPLLSYPNMTYLVQDHSPVFRYLLLIFKDLFWFSNIHQYTFIFILYSKFFCRKSLLSYLTSNICSTIVVNFTSRGKIILILISLNPYHPYKIFLWDYHHISHHANFFPKQLLNSYFFGSFHYILLLNKFS